MAFELAQSRVVVREGAGFVPNGTEFDVVKQDSSRMNLRIRAWHFPVEADAAPVRFQITDMVDPDYRSINATVLRSVSVSFGHGQAPMMQSRLEAVGMCSQVSSRGES